MPFLFILKRPSFLLKGEAVAISVHLVHAVLFFICLKGEAIAISIHLEENLIFRCLKGEVIAISVHFEEARLVFFFFEGENYRHFFSS